MKLGEVCAGVALVGLIIAVLWLWADRQRECAAKGGALVRGVSEWVCVAKK